MFDQYKILKKIEYFFLWHSRKSSGDLEDGCHAQYTDVQQQVEGASHLFIFRLYSRGQEEANSIHCGTQTLGEGVRSWTKEPVVQYDMYQNFPEYFVELNSKFKDLLEDKEDGVKQIINTLR